MTPFEDAVHNQEEQKNGHGCRLEVVDVDA